MKLSRLAFYGFLGMIVLVLAACFGDKESSEPGQSPVYPLAQETRKEIEEAEVVLPDRNPTEDAKDDTRLANWPEEVRQRLESVARITVEIEGLLKKDNYTRMGSGTLLRDDLVLTALHIFPSFEDLILSKNLVVQVFIGNRIIAGFIPDRSYFEPASDLAVIKLKERLNLVPIPLAKSEPAVGSTLYTFGYAFISRPLALEFRFKGAAWSRGKRYLVVSRSFEHGYSGSPLLNSRGELVGLNEAVTQKGVFGLAISLAYVKKFIEGIK